MDLTRNASQKKGSIAIDQTMLLVLAVVVLAILVGFYVLLGDKAAEMVADALDFNIGE